MTRFPAHAITLRSPQLTVVLDPHRGAEVFSVVHNDSGSEIMWSTPTRDRAEHVLAGAPVVSTDSFTNFFAGYRGGWQTLCPNAGAARTVHGASLGFHGEVAVSAWTVVDAGDHFAVLRLELLSLPVRIHREVRLNGNILQVQDRLTNLSTQALEFDYVQHPAFGADLLADECRIETGARRFTADPETNGTLAAGEQFCWPDATTVAGRPLDLARLPAPGESQLVFGWLSDFERPWYRLTNRRTGLAVDVEWDAEHLPYAWFWQELNHSADFPWYRRARVLAIEPASTQTSGAERRSVLALAPGQSTTIRTTLAVSRSGAAAD
jgi:galactose mutarotase-like enzyme